MSIDRSGGYCATHQRNHTDGCLDCALAHVTRLQAQLDEHKEMYAGLSMRHDVQASVYKEVDAELEALKAAQGEPVVWLDPDSGRKANTISAALKKYNEAKGGAPAAAAAIYTVPLYAAPVAVVLPERRNPKCTGAISDFTTFEEARGWNAYDAELKRLNPSL